MLRSRPFAALLVLAWFALVSKAAYQASFSDDDLSNIALMQVMNAREWLGYLLSPRLSLDNVRPVGLLYYGVLGAAAGLRYGVYVLVLQALHLGATALLWTWLRPRGWWPATAGALLFAGYGATMAAYWKPMYVFDVLCALLTMAALLAYQRGRWVWAFVFFWLAYKAKESAIALPAVLTLYEWLFPNGSGRERWVRLAPFWLAAVSFGLQAIGQPARPNHDYDMHLSAAAVAACVLFYAGQVVGVPFGGLALGILPVLVRRREVVFGFIAFWLLLGPMLAFPGRLQSAYLYGPLLLLMIAAGGVVSAYPRAAGAVVLAALPLCYLQMREGRKPILALGHEHGPYVAQVVGQLSRLAGLQVAVYDGSPQTMGNWGTSGLLRIASHNPHLTVYAADSPEGGKAARLPGTPVVHWNGLAHRLFVERFDPALPPLPFIDFATQDPVWQLDEGWFGVAGPCRWTAPRAKLTLGAPPGGASRMFLRVNVAAGQTALSPVVRVVSDGQELLAGSLARAGWHEFSGLTVVHGTGDRRVEITVSPGFLPSVEGPPLGVLVCAVGFTATVGGRPEWGSRERLP